MFTLQADSDEYYRNKNGYYEEKTEQLHSLFAGETHAIANMSQFSAFVFQLLPDLNWAGFYLVDKPEKLILGPFQGGVACVHIPFAKGVCGKSARTMSVQRIADVHQFDDHIACDSATNAEIVIPVLKNGRLIGVFDIDSPEYNRFDDIDEKYLVEWVNYIAEHSDFGGI